MDIGQTLGTEIEAAFGRAGITTSGSHPLQFCLYYPNEGAARAVADRLGPEGFDCEVAPSVDGRGWSCFVRKFLPVDVPALNDLGKRLSSWSAEFGETFDGWDRDSSCDGTRF